MLLSSYGAGLVLRSSKDALWVVKAKPSLRGRHGFDL